MRIVADTNVLVSALLFGGNPEQVLLSALSGQVELFTSDALLEELQRVLAQKLHVPPEKERELLDVVRSVAQTVSPTDQIDVIKECEADNRVLECGLAAGAQVIVTGDTRHILPIGSFRGIRIVSPATFVEEYLR